MTNGVELIIYLEPSPKFRQRVETFLRDMDRKYGPTTASKYGCHISMTGFFNVEPDYIVELRDKLENIIHSIIDSRSTTGVPQINLNSLIVNDPLLTDRPKHLLLPVTAPDVYHVAMETLREQCKHIVALRLKKINHISLAYWDEPEATVVQQDKWQKMMTKGLFDKIKQDASVYFKTVDDPVVWDIVLYKRVSKGALVGQHHVFEELGRWSSSTTI